MKCSQGQIVDTTSLLPPHHQRIIPDPPVNMYKIKLILLHEEKIKIEIMFKRFNSSNLINDSNFNLGALLKYF